MVFEDLDIAERLTDNTNVRVVVEKFLTYSMSSDGLVEVRAVDITRTMPQRRFGMVDLREDGTGTVTAVLVVNPADLAAMRNAICEDRPLGYSLTRTFWIGGSWKAAPPLDTGSKEAVVAGDIEVKHFARQRVEYWIPTADSGTAVGARFEDLYQAYAWAGQELEKRGVVKKGANIEGHVRIKPSDEHVIVYVEFDEEQK